MFGGRSPVKWMDRVREYVRERGEGSLRNLEQARRECQDRERWKLSAVAILWWELLGAGVKMNLNELKQSSQIFT